MRSTSTSDVQTFSVVSLHVRRSYVDLTMIIMTLKRFDFCIIWCFCCTMLRHGIRVQSLAEHISTAPQHSNRGHYRCPHPPHTSTLILGFVYYPVKDRTCYAVCLQLHAICLDNSLVQITKESLYGSAYAWLSMTKRSPKRVKFSTLL